MDIEGFRRGDEGVFADFISEHSPRLLAAALRLTQERARAHELVHDAWVRAYERRTTFGGSGSFVGWMLAILQSVWRQDIRGDVRRRETVERSGHLAEQPHDPREALTAALDGRRAQGDLLDALAGLTERQRDVVAMRVIEERSVAETAEALGIAEGTVKATLHQALDRMRKLYKGGVP